MEYLNSRESVLNCDICRVSAIRKHKRFPEYIKHFSPEMHQFWQHNYVPVSEEPSHHQEQEYLKKSKNKAKQPNYMSPHKEGYEQLYRKLLEKKVKSNHKIRKSHVKKPAIVYQVYTLTTNNDKPKRKQSSSIIYSYPYSSSSSDTTVSIKRANEKKKSVTMHPSTKIRTSDEDEEDTDSEFNTCNKFPITERHYRHIVDGIECSTSQKPTYSRKNRRGEEKITRRADVDFNENYFEQSFRNNLQENLAKTKKKCHCRNKCKPDVHHEEGSDSELSEKTFAKFINSLHSYVNKAKKYSHHKKERKRLDIDSSCSVCQHRAKHLEKKSKDNYNKKHHHHHHHRHHHQQSHYKAEPAETMFAKFLNPK